MLRKILLIVTILTLSACASTEVGDTKVAKSEEAKSAEKPQARACNKRSTGFRTRRC
ncbi:hypothetical protein ACUR5C_11660 [Aliikangiella sp. IMCC44653]